MAQSPTYVKLPMAQSPTSCKAGDNLRRSG
jgi:hypothetical protein